MTSRVCPMTWSFRSVRSSVEVRTTSITHFTDTNLITHNTRWSSTASRRSIFLRRKSVFGSCHVILIFNLWPWKPFQRCALTCWMCATCCWSHRTKFHVKWVSMYGQQSRQTAVSQMVLLSRKSTFDLWPVTLTCDLDDCLRQVSLKSLH